MDIGEALQSAGIRREDVLESAFCAIVVIVVAMVYGLVAPTSLTVMTLAIVLKSDDPAGPSIAALAAVLAGAVVAAIVLSVWLIERRWPWPIGSRVVRPNASSPAFGRLLLLLSVVSPFLDAFGVWWPIGLPRMASGSYPISDNPETWLRVVAPADFATSAVVGLADWVAYVAIIVAVVAVWRGVRRRHGI